MIECERFKITRQQQTFCTLGCLCLLHYKHLCSWRGITWTIYAHQKDREDLTLKQKFQMSEKLISEQSVEMYGVNEIIWEDSVWKQLFLIGDEEVIGLLHTMVYVFSDSVFCFGKIKHSPTSNSAWEDNLMWFKSSPEHRVLDKIDGQPMEFEWNIFPGFIVRLMNSRQRSKKYDDKSAVAMLKKSDWQERESVTDGCHDRPGKLGKRGDKQLGRNSSKRQLSDARQLGCVFQDMTPPKSILRKSTDMPKPIQRVKFKKAIARHAKIRDQNPSLGYICPGEPHERSPMLQNLRIVHRKRQCGKS